MSLDNRVSSLYKIAKEYPEDPNLQEAVSVIKSLRLSQGQFRRWNDQYRTDNTELKGEITHLSQDNAELEKEVVKLSQDSKLLKFELVTLNQEMVQLTQEKSQLVAEKAKVIAELKNIQTEVEVAALKVKQTQSLFGKFSILWTLVHSLFFEGESGDFGIIDPSLLPDPDKPQMGTSPADIGRDLLGR